MADSPLLNPNQITAIEHTQGPLLIIAGAGTGKTTVVTERIKHLILKKNVLPSQILALTFTEKAAQEMEERIDMAMPYGYSQMWILTFHAFCDRILRNEAVHLGLTPSYRLMTESQSILFLRKNLFKFELDYFRPLGNPHKFLEGMLQHFSRLSDEDISPQDYLKYAQEISKGAHDANSSLKPSADSMEIKKTVELAKAFAMYETLKAEAGVMDFSNLITNTLALFRERPNILANYQKQFEYILVDEFQDTNYAQNMLAISLAGDKKNIAVVGDDDQAIYRWRGAALSNMLQFTSHFQDAKIVTLTQNYRSTQEILDKSYQLISFNNPDRLEVQQHIDKKLIAERKTKQYPIELLYEERVEDEAECVTKKIEELMQKEHYTYRDFAILIRANDHAQPFVRSLQRSNIPFQFLGPGRLFRQEEIKDLIAYLKVLYDFGDSLSLYRLLSLPIFDISARDIAALMIVARKKNLSLFEALEKASEEPGDQKEFLSNEQTREKIITILEMLRRHLKLVPHENAGQILYYFIQDTGLLQKFLSAKTEQEVKQYQNIAKFFDKLKSFEAENEDARIFPIIEWIDLSMQMGESPLAADTDWSDNNAVNILTIHSSKGLEFPVVFLVNLVSQRFPTRQRQEQIPIPQALIKEILPSGDYHLQEERRLFYVGMTRAKDHLFLTAANFYGEGKRDRKLSPFIYEALSQEKVEILLKQKHSTKMLIQPSLLDWAEKKMDNPVLYDSSQSQNSNWRLNYISYSQLQTYDICPLHYKLQYILKIPSEPAAALSFGTSLHGALRDIYQDRINNSSSPLNTIESVLQKNWIIEGYKSKDHEQIAYKRAQVVLQQYLDSDHTNSNKKILAVETPFQFFVTNKDIRPSSLKVGGRIDRVDSIDSNTIEIIDYKTGSHVPTQKEADSNLQLTFYALAATQVHDSIFGKPPENILLSLHYIEENQKITTTRTQEQLEEAKINILQKVNEIEKSEFICSQSIFCHKCEYNMLCSIS